MKKTRTLRPGDLLLMAAIGLAAILLFILPFLSDQAESAQIEIVETGEVRIISLSSDGAYEVISRGVHLTVCVSDGQAFVSESDCRDGICRGTAPISRAGQTIVCAPAGVVVRILGEEAMVDGVTR